MARLKNENLIHFDILWKYVGFDYSENFVGFIRSEHLPGVNCEFLNVICNHCKSSEILFFMGFWFVEVG
jgi:hypothetical protein